MTRFVSCWADNAGVRLHYLDSAPHVAGSHDTGGDQIPVLFMPGFGEEAADHHDLFDTLAPRRVIVPDLRGRGPSDVPEGPYGLDDHVGDVDAVITATGIHSLHLASYSRGTAYALGWGAANPSRLASVTVAEYPAAQLVPPAGAATMVGQRVRFGRPITERIPAPVIEKIFDQAELHLFYDDLAMMSAPLLVIHASRRSTLVSPEALDAYKAARPDTTFETFADSGHDLWRPDPSRVARRLHDFLESVEHGVELGP